jgi:hypothetical protein
MNIKPIFEKLNDLIALENIERRDNSTRTLPKSEIKILGQMSLLLDEKTSAVISLNQTGDLDALIDAEYFVKKNLKVLLADQGLVYDEDSEKIFLPPGHFFDLLWDLDNVVVKKLDAESALVSKAIKSRDKNRILIRRALLTGLYKTLEKRIIELGGDLDFFEQRD